MRTDACEVERKNDKENPQTTQNTSEEESESIIEATTSDSQDPNFLKQRGRCLVSHKNRILQEHRGLGLGW